MWKFREFFVLKPFVMLVKVNFDPNIGSPTAEAKDILGRVHSYETDDSDIPESESDDNDSD